MRQTPFGVWNMDTILRRKRCHHTAMRQTPFGVWNKDPGGSADGRVDNCNEADAFWRLELWRIATLMAGYPNTAMRQTPFGVWNYPLMLAVAQIVRTAMRQTPFGVWNLDVVAKGGVDNDTAMRQTPFGVWNA